MVLYDDEAALVAAAKDGDPAGFTELVNRPERRIFRLTRNITQNHEDAEDAMQDAFLKAYQHLDEFQGESRFSTWLARIAVNEALMKLRKRRAGHFSIDEPLADEDEPLPMNLEAWDPTPEERYSQQELQDVLSGAMGQLTPALRSVFQLRDVEGLSTEETARTLGLTTAAVKSRLFRARLELRGELNQHFRPSPRVSPNTDDERGRAQ
jgi:RNA polymerase sigma-70 factor (ECF subfamily)